MKDHVLELDKTRTLRFGFKANRMIRQKFGDRTIEDLLNTLKVDEMPILAWAGLKWEDNALTVEQVEDLLDTVIPKKYTIMKVTEIILEALAEHMGANLKKVKADAPEIQKMEEEDPETIPEILRVSVPAEEKTQPTKTIPSTKKQKKSP